MGNKRRSWLKIICTLALFCMVMCSTVFMPVNTDTARAGAADGTGTKAKTVTVGQFSRMILDAAGLDMLEVLKDDAYRENYRKITEKDPSEAVTYMEAAAMLNVADERLALADGYYAYTLYDAGIYNFVTSRGRISDYGKVKNSVWQWSIAKTFTKGIYVGYSNGKYSQSRDLRLDKEVTVSAAKNMVKRLTDKGKRIRLSPDGQVIRKTNLPKNHKQYAYILASFPNSYYEKETFYTKRWYDKNSRRAKKTLELHDMEDMWAVCDVAAKNLTLRLNVDYRSSLTKEWKRELCKTWSPSDGGKSLWEAADLYIRDAKKNKVVLKASEIVVEPSGCWQSYGTNMMVRAYIKFTVGKNTVVPDYKTTDQDDVIMGNWVAIKKLKPGATITKIIDVPMRISGNNGRLNRIQVDTVADCLFDWAG